MTPEQKNAWAWSPEGLKFQLSGVAGAAGGQHGARAVENIIRLYERPADPNGEVSRALGGESLPVPAAGGAATASFAGGTGAPNRRAFAQALLSAISPTGQLENQGLSQALQARNQPLQAAWGDHPGSGAVVGGKAGQGQAGLPPIKPSKFSAGIAELLREGTGGPTHSTGPHIHAAFTDPNLELAAIGWAQGHGLHVGENPYVGSMPAGGVHAPHSYHYRDFPGRYNGRKLGQAIDVSGATADAFYKWLASGGRR